MLGRFLKYFEGIHLGMDTPKYTFMFYRDKNINLGFSNQQLQKPSKCTRSQNVKQH